MLAHCSKAFFRGCDGRIWEGEECRLYSLDDWPADLWLVGCCLGRETWMVGLSCFQGGLLGSLVLFL